MRRSKPDRKATAQCRTAPSAHAPPRPAGRRGAIAARIVLAGSAALFTAGSLAAAPLADADARSGQEAARPAATPSTTTVTTTAPAPIRVAQAATEPLIVEGPVQATPGSTASFPVRVSPNAASRSRYVVVLKAPDWLGFDGGELIGSGVWLIDRNKLDSVKLKVAPSATGTHELAVGLGGKNGSIESVATLKVAVAPAAAKVPETTGAIDGRPAPAPVPATRPAAEPPARAPAPAQAASSTAQSAPARVAQAAPEVPPNAGGGFTWETLVGGNKPSTSPSPATAAKPVAAGPARTEAELIQEAKHLVRECTTCHNLYGQDVGIPVMVGLTVDRFLDTMDLYRREKRDHKLMQVISKSLSEDETKALALYLSRIKPAAAGDRGGSGTSRTAPAETQASAQQPMAIVTKRDSDPKTEQRVARWLKRGEAMLDAGDIAQARLLLQRASEFGNARAAFLMATSFDPNALPWKPNIGMVAEPLKARRWYLLAKSLGLGGEVEQRLADLPVPN